MMAVLSRVAAVTPHPAPLKAQPCRCCEAGHNVQKIAGQANTMMRSATSKNTRCRDVGSCAKDGRTEARSRGNCADLKLGLCNQQRACSEKKTHVMNCRTSVYQCASAQRGLTRTHAVPAARDNSTLPACMADAVLLSGTICASTQLRTGTSNKLTYPAV
jgi:hypothetical protein